MQASRTSTVLDTLAVDVGFFQTKYTLGRTSSPKGIGTAIQVGSFPSVAPQSIEVELQGATAPQGVNIAHNNMKFFVGKGAMNLLDSTGLVREASEHYCHTNEYAALFKGALWHIAAHHRVTGSMTVKHLVVGLPMSTIYEEADFIESLCLGVHELPSTDAEPRAIKIDVKSVTVVAQPHGGSVNFVRNAPVGLVKPTDKILLIDMGGGTFDWFVSNPDHTPIPRLCGATNVGTLKVATEVASMIKSSFKSNQFAIDAIDMALRTGSKQIEIGSSVYEVNDYWEKVCSTVMSAITKMMSSVKSMDIIKHIIVSGGGALLVERVLREKMPELANLIRVDSDPVHANVKGFHQIGEFLNQ